jgi:hypothetical protein
MKRLLLALSLVLVVGVFLVVPAQSQTPKTYTCSWNHDGVGVDNFIVLVDGAAATITVTCSGVGATRLCSTPLTMTTGAAHIVVVEAVGTFGTASSDPFDARPPVKPLAVVVR